MAALPAPHPDRPSLTRRPRPARGPPRQRLGGVSARARRGGGGARRRRARGGQAGPRAATARAPCFQCAPFRRAGVRCGAAVARRRPQRGTAAGETSAGGGLLHPTADSCALSRGSSRTVAVKVSVPTGTTCTSFDPCSGSLATSSSRLIFDGH